MHGGKEWKGGKGKKRNRDGKCGIRTRGRRVADVRRRGKQGRKIEDMG